MYWTSWDAIDFCTNLDKNVRLETARKFLKSSGFRLGFFNSGVIKAESSEAGREASSKEKLTISVITGNRIGT